LLPHAFASKTALRVITHSFAKYGANPSPGGYWANDANTRKKVPYWAFVDIALQRED